MSDQKKNLAKAIHALKEIGQKLDIHPSQISAAEFFDNTEGISEWQLRQLGGLSGVKKYFPIETKDLIVVQKEKEISKYVRSLEAKAAQTMLMSDTVESLIKDVLKDLPIETVEIPKIKSTDGQKMTVELMLSDIHYGKKTKHFNYKICRQRMKKLSEVFLQELERKQKEGYEVERIVIALLGDLLESFTMHGLESAVGCEFGNAQQVQAAITSLYYDVILPIAKTGIKIDVPCVTGNHDRYETYRTMNDPGLNNLTWIIYSSLAEYCDLSGLKNVKFDIAKGPYIIGKIYDNNILWEHSDNCKNNSKKSFENLMEARGRQNNITIHFGRFGHWHEYACYDRGRIIVNESACGQDSYADVLGFDTKVGQTINYYVKTSNRPNCFYCSFPVDLSSK